MNDDIHLNPEDDGAQFCEPQVLPGSSMDRASLRELIRAAEAGESVTLPPDVIRALTEMQKTLARSLIPYLELQKDFKVEFLASALQQIAQAVHALPALDTAAASMAAGLRPIIELSEQIQRQLASSRWQQAMAALLQVLAAIPHPSSWWPPNWDTRSLSAADIEAAMTILTDEGIPLAWVPRAAIVAELVRAPDVAARQAILAARIPEIVEDCREVLKIILDPELKPLVDLSEPLLVALRAAPEAAQALATNIFDTFLREANRRGQMFGGNFGYERVTRRITAVSDDTPINGFRTACVLTPMILALRSYNPETDPIPTEFGRHSTVHRAHPQHYTPANAVIAVMLAVSLLRQAHDLGW